MNHAKRMVLVPEEQNESLNSIPQPSAPVNSFRSIDSDIESILFNKKLSDHDKYTLYSDVVNKYLLKFNAAREGIKVKKEHLNDNLYDDYVQRAEEMDWESNSIEDQQNMVILKNLFKQSADISWDRSGSTYVFGEQIGAKINDLIKNMFNENTDKTPAGWGVFMEAVKKLNIPSEYLPSQAKKRKLFEPNNDKSRAKFRKMDNPQGIKRNHEESESEPKRVKISVAQATKRKIDSDDEDEISPRKKIIIPVPSMKRKYEDEDSDDSDIVDRKKFIVHVPTRKRKNEDEDSDDSDIVPRKKYIATQSRKRKSDLDPSEEIANKKLKKMSSENSRKRKNTFDEPPTKRVKTEPRGKKRSIVAEEAPGGKRRKLELSVGTKNKNAKKIKWIAFK